MSLSAFTKNAALAKLPQLIDGFDQCIYFSSDYQRFISLRAALKDQGKMSLPGIHFHQHLTQLQEPFLKLSAQINKDCQGLSFWSTHTGSRNSLSFPLFKNLIYLSVAKSLALSQNSRRLLFIFESKATLQTFVYWCRRNKINCSVKMAPIDQVTALRQRLAHLGHGLGFLARGARTWLSARALSNARISAESSSPKYLLRTWITAGSVTDEFKFTNRNFGALPGYLSRKSKEVWILPMFFNLDRSPIQQISLMAKTMMKTGYKFIFKEQYLLPQDYFVILGRGLRETCRRFDPYEFQGDGIHSMLREAHLKTCFYGELLDFNLSERLVHRLKLRNIHFEKVIYPLENNVVEKPFTMAVKRDFPHTSLLGFQHTVWVKEQAGALLSPGEIQFHPQPDQIICCGPRYVEILTNSGFPPAQLKRGANLRYSELHSITGAKPMDTSGNSDVGTLAIVLNAFWEESAELLDQTKKALLHLMRAGESFKIVVKLHPLLKIETVKAYLQDIEFPDYEIVNKNVLDIAATSKGVLMPSASVSNLEIIVSGTPLLRISSGANFDLDPLWDDYPLFPVAMTPEDIAISIKKALHLNPADYVELRNYGQKILRSYFTPVSDDALEVFL